MWSHDVKQILIKCEQTKQKGFKIKDQLIILS